MAPNKLLHNQQPAQLKAQHGLLPAYRDSNAALVGQHAARITAWRNGAGLSDAGWPKVEPSLRSVVT